MIGLEDVRAAHARIRGHVRCTPVLTSEALDQIAGARLYFKCENLQPMGAFKLRGASNAVLQLADPRRGVATHSSGNHGAALACAARNLGIPAHVVMPGNAPAAKKANVARYGARIIECEAGLAARERTLEAVIDETGAQVVHPYDDDRVIAGQGTAALELLEAHGNLDAILIPIGGGGLAAGTAVCAKGIAAGIEVIAVEPAGADDAYRSWRAGTRLPSVAPRTIADGLLTSVGERNWALLRAHLDDVVTVSEAAIVAAMRSLWQHLRVVVEPSAAVPFAALQSGAYSVAGREVGIILTGGNVDLDTLPWQSPKPEPPGWR